MRDNFRKALERLKFKRPRREVGEAETKRLKVTLTVESILKIFPFFGFIIALFLIMTELTRALAAPPHVAMQVRYVNATFTLFGRESVIRIPASIFDPSFVFMITIVLTVTALPTALYEYKTYRMLSRIEDQLPLAIRIVADMLRTGTTIERAMELLARSGLRPLNMVIARALLLTRYRAISIIDSLRAVGQQIGSPDIVRFADLLELAGRYGARAEEMLDVAARSMEAIQAYKREKYTHLRPYVALVYIIVFVYIVICDLIAALGSGVLILKAPIFQQSPEAAQTSTLKIKISAEAAKLRMNALLGFEQYLLLTQLFAAALVIGRVVYERPLCGLIHFVILSPTSYFAVYGVMEILLKILSTAFPTG